MYTDTLKDIIGGWPWASPERKAAIQGQISACSTSDPGTFLTELIVAHRADNENHVPQFQEHLNRLLYQYQQEGPGEDADATFVRILNEYSNVGTTLL